MNVNFPSNKSPNNYWDEIVSRLLAKTWNKKQVNFESSDRVTTSPSTASRVTTSSSASRATTSSSSSVSDGETVKLPLLTAADKENIAAKYAAMKKDCMWKLSTGTIVEEKMLECAMDQTHEHMAHSLILNVHDADWLKYFTKQEIEEIRNHECVEVPATPDAAIKYLHQLKGLSEQELYEKLTMEKLDIISDEKWIQDAFIQATRLIKSMFIPINRTKTTEGGLLKRMWSCIDTCYDFSPVKCISGEVCSKSSADAMNSMRSSLLCRQKPGRKMDFIFSYNDYEVGCGECGMDVATNSTKELYDYGYKMPKVMRDMLSKLVSYSPSLKRKLVISEKQLKVVLLDTPVGYVTRYDALEAVRYPQNHNELYRQLWAVLRIILDGRMLMENTGAMLTSDDTDISIGRRREEQMVPNFMTISSNSKRLRQSQDL